MAFFNRFLSSKRGEPKQGRKQEQKKAPVAEISEDAPPKPQAPGKYSGGVLLASRVTEKSTLAGALNKYVFTVARTSTKKEVAKAIERKYGVHVSAVNIINAPSKKVRLGRTIGHVPGFKKAVVTLEDGQRIEVGV